MEPIETRSTSRHEGALARTIASRDATVAVIGLGYVGLALAVARAGRLRGDRRRGRPR